HQLPPPKALIVPHAGFVYSGSIAAAAYASLKPVKQKIKRVILLGPCHRYPLFGLAVTAADFYATPLGKIPIDQASIKDILQLPYVQVSEPAFNTQENSLETQLPFLQMTLDEFSIVPILIGQARETVVASVIDRLWHEEDTLIVISSDLSHYLDYETACRLDKKTANAILHLDPQAIQDDQACGSIGIKALLLIALKKGLTPRLVKLQNSGDIVGSYHEGVVGYGAFHFTSGNESAGKGMSIENSVRKNV
ncbi:MAG TPA: AmmeMemoRadiSam system protein B, partial [Coxiellaceae bacterium]|nr:AmmeMemoRadiSam system protein B [Coxiellaceae bacterium]